MPFQLKFLPSELPNPTVITSPENIAFIKKKRAELEAAEAKAEASKAANPSADTSVQKKRKLSEAGNVGPSTKRAKDQETVLKSSAASASSASDPFAANSAAAGAGVESRAPDSANSPALEDLDEEALIAKLRKDWEDLFDVGLVGDEDESVEIYDSCDEIRDKIESHLRATNMKNAAFLRDIARAGWPLNPPRIQSKQLNDFLAKEGAASGSTSRIFYGAYVYFEKKRIFEGLPKSEHRSDMEDEWPNGMPRERNWNKVYFGGPGDSVWTNEYGRVTSGFTGFGF